LQNIAGAIVHFALEFGVVLNEKFGPRMATIGFANAVILGLREPENAAKLEAMLAAESVPLDEELVGLTQAFIAAFPRVSDWTNEVSCFLRKQWRLSADDAPNIEPRLETALRVLHGIRFGLIVTRESPETAHKVEEHTKTLWAENRFLSALLYYWSDHEFEPYAPPFVEFTAYCYQPGTVERRVIRQAVAEIYPIAKALNNPWSFPFWVEVGWNGGRNFVRNHPEDCKALLKEPSYPTNFQQTYKISEERRCLGFLIIRLARSIFAFEMKL